MAIEQFVPFMSDYKFFDDMGIRTYDNGHSFTGVNFSIHSKYKGIPAYDEAMQARYGPERSAQILGMARHNTVYYPNLTIKGAIQAIRVVKPIAVDRTLVESWTFRLKGAPPEMLQRTSMYSRLINSPFSVVGHDDLQAYRGIQAGLHASGNEWVSLHRNFDAAETRGGEITTGGTSDDDRIAFLWKRVLSRLPSPEERTLMKGLLTRRRDEFKADPKAAGELLAVGIAPRDKTLDPIELAAWTTAARAVLNLYEAIARY